MFPKIGVPQNGWFILENPFKMDDLGVITLFLETPIYVFISNTCGVLWIFYLPHPGFNEWLNKGLVFGIPGHKNVMSSWW